MVKPAVRRRMAEWAQSSFQVSERRACHVLGLARSMVRYQSRKADQEPLRRRLLELASVRTYAGYRRLHTHLLREGWSVNHKRVYRLYMEEGLALRRKKPRRRRSAVSRKARIEPTRPNQCWAMDFMHDSLYRKGPIRIFTLIDVYSRECLALVPARSFSGLSVAQVLSAVGEKQAFPKRIQVDNGPEFTSKDLDAWAYQNRVQLDFSRPGRPGDNAHIEAFNSLVRRECLSQHWFFSLEEARRLLREWKDEYNQDRPHGSLGRRTPDEYLEELGGA